MHTQNYLSAFPLNFYIQPLLFPVHKIAPDYQRLLGWLQDGKGYCQHHSYHFSFVTHPIFFTAPAALHTSMHSNIYH